MKNKTFLKSMLDEFEEKLGHRLSDQMESYLINLYTANSNVDD